MINDSRLLAMLAAHAHAHGEQRCHLLADRVITYRRLWSRIERASARLQGEWGVRAGQTVAYVGHSHPDALVLYAALLRIGAFFLPLESVPRPSAMHLLALTGATLALVDENVTLGDFPVRPLSQLLAQWCHFDPVIVDENPVVRALLLPSSSAGIEAFSLDDLCAALPAALFTTRVSGPIFDRVTLSTVILPLLRDVQTLHFSAAE